MANLYRMSTGGRGSDIKPYTVNFQCGYGYLGQTMTMTQIGHDTVSGTVKSDGTLTLYPLYSGTWECECYSISTSVSMKKTIDLSYWGVQPTIEFYDTPNGATVTPTDDVQTLLHCANIWNLSYTSVAQLLADNTSLYNILNDNNSIDYLARSTTFASDFCANSNAMTYIGLNDYCANSLVGNNAWLEEICNSTYFEKVLNEKVPTMTTNTTPSGMCLYTNESASHKAYMAFDNNEATWWELPSATSSSVYIGYKFDEAINVKKIYINSYTGSDLNCTVRYSDDNSTWNNAWNFVCPATQKATSNADRDYGKHKYWRIDKICADSATRMHSTRNVQFWGRK